MVVGLVGYGIGCGVCMVVMVWFFLEFFLLMFVLFKLGVVLVLVDLGIDWCVLK